MDKLYSRQPTLKESMNAIVRILIAYHLLVEGREQIHTLGEDIPNTLRGLVVMAYSVPIASLINDDPLLSQHKQEVCQTLCKMLETN